MAYGFVIGPEGAFGLNAYPWPPLHACIDGWVPLIAHEPGTAPWL